MDILGGGIEEKNTAVVIAASQVNAIPLEKVCDNFLSQAAQVAGDDEVIKVGGASCFLKMGVECGVGGRGHGSPMLLASVIPLSTTLPVVTWVIKGPVPLRDRMTAPDPVVVHWAVGGFCPPYSQRVAVLALCRAKMGGGQSRCVGSKPPVHQHGRQRHPFRHGGAGAV